MNKYGPSTLSSFVLLLFFFHNHLIKDVITLFQMKEFPEFSWSHSRHKLLMECPRKYGYTYYISHNGWLFDAPLLAQQAYRLKKLTTLPMFFGQAVHNVIEKTIKRYMKHHYIPTVSELEATVRSDLRKAFIDSRDHGDLWYHKPNHYIMFFEFYKHGYLTKTETKEINDRLGTCLHHFLQSKTFKELTSHPAINIIESKKFRSTYVDHIKMYAVLDLLYQDDGKYVIVDWKTGKHSTDDLTQLAVYALYVMKKYEIPLEKIEIRNEYLLTGSCHTYQLNSQDIQSLLNLMATSIDMMTTYLKQPDENNPLPLHSFPENGNPFQCNQCFYKELCESIE
ncbi:PD-(D/E)XK nuclease family protein [Priestia megaterium]|nr:PD-(D/E)XK nuclease family protein [Priestia megaterium]